MLGQSRGVEMLETLNRLMAYAVEQFGRDRIYSVRFGGSTPIVEVCSNDSSRIVALWDVNGEITVKRFGKT